MYYRDEEHVNYANISALFRKLDLIYLPEDEDVEFIFNITAAQRGRRNELLTGDLSSSTTAIGSDQESSERSDCARVALYVAEEVVNDGYEELVFDTSEGEPEPICASECSTGGEV